MYTWAWTRGRGGHVGAWPTRGNNVRPKTTRMSGRKREYPAENEKIRARMLRLKFVKRSAQKVSGLCFYLLTIRRKNPVFDEKIRRKKVRFLDPNSPLRPLCRLLTSSPTSNGLDPRRKSVFLTRNHQKMFVSKQGLTVSFKIRQKSGFLTRIHF
jgi:hypothetical protein